MITYAQISKAGKREKSALNWGGKNFYCWKFEKERTRKNYLKPLSGKIQNMISHLNDLLKEKESWASLVAQWLRICLPMQGTRVWDLVWEDPTCRGAAGPVSHNYWACASGACALQQERPRQWKAHAPRWRVAPACHN